MRILAIRGCNLASLAGEFEIDLSRAPFSDAGVFAIVGNTGAGKSTLLDALCVALFDRTPRLTNHSRVVVGRGDDDPGALGAQDVRTLLRRGAAAGWAEVDFEAGDARRYRARWSVRRARNQTDGTLQDQQLTLTAIDGGERFGGTKTETLKAIVARLGLTFDQFRRSALLAQGEFAAFLRADGKDRSELLERMTGTEIYSRLSVAAHLRASIAEQRLRDGRARAEAIPILADDAREAAHAALAVAEHAKVAARARLAEAEAIARWREEHRRLRAALAEAERDHASAAAAVTAADADRAELALRRRAEQLRGVWEDAARIDRALAIARAEVGAAEAALHDTRATHETILARRASLAALHAPIRAARIAAGIVERASSPNVSAAPTRASASAASERTAEELLSIAAPDAAWLIARPALGPEVAGWPELDTRFAQHGALVDAIAAIDRTVRDHTSTRNKLVNARTAVALDHAAAAHKLADAQRKATTFHQRRGLTLDAARRQEDEARTRVSEVERLVSIATTAREAIGVRDQIDQQLVEIEEHATHDAQHHARLTTERTLAAAIRAERARVVEDLRRAAGYEHARAELEDDEPCPLCGATEHPWKERGAFDDVIRVEEARLAEVTATVEATSSALAALAARAQQRDKERQRLTRSRETAVASAASDLSRWRDQLAALGELLLEGDPSTLDAARIAADLDATARARLEQARMVFSQTQAATKAAQEAHAEMQLAQANVDSIHEHLADHDRRVAELDATLQRLAGERTSRTERRLELEADLTAAIARWRAAASSTSFARAPSDVHARAASSDVPAGAASSDVPAGAASSDVPAGAASPAVPAGAASSDVPARAASPDVPAGAASSDVPPRAASPAVHAAVAPASERISTRNRAARATERDITIPGNLLDARGAMSELAAAWRSRADRVALADAAALAAVASIERAEQEAARGVAEHAATHESAARRRDALVFELRDAAARLDEARFVSGFDVDALRRLLAADASRADELATALAALDRAVERTRAVVAERRERFEAHVPPIATALADTRGTSLATAATPALGETHATSRDIAATTADASTHASAATTADAGTHASAATTAVAGTHASAATAADTSTHASAATAADASTHASAATTADTSTHASAATAADASTHASAATTADASTHASAATAADASTHASVATPMDATTHATSLDVARDTAGAAARATSLESALESALDASCRSEIDTPGYLRALADTVEVADHQAATLAATLAADTDARTRRQAALAALATEESGAETDRVLGEVIGSHDGKLFRSFAQSLTLDSLLDVANAHLEELAPRYQLERVPRHDLELQVIDRDLGAEVRSVQSLSGGESFLVSLALALGLSSMSAHDVRVRTLLIDEGFGTLDPSTLDSALSVLDALQATGRQVGVISHVPALVERVGAHVRVIQRGGGRSEVVVA